MEATTISKRQARKEARRAARVVAMLNRAREIRERATYEARRA